MKSEIAALKYHLTPSTTPATVVGKVFSITPPTRTREPIEETCLGAGPELFRASAIYNNGEYKVSVYHEVDNATHLALVNAYNTGATLCWGLCYDGTTIQEQFNGFIKEWTQGEFAKGNNIVSEFTIVVVGDITITEGD